MRWLLTVSVVALCASMVLRATVAATADHEPTPMAETQIVKEDFRGWPNTYRLQNGLVEVRVVTDIGPRIMDFHLAGASNLLYVRDSEAGKQGEAYWVQRGGWRLWVAPERRDSTYALDNARCDVEVAADTVRVNAPPQAAAGIRKRVDVTLRPGEPGVRITAHIVNITDRPLTYAAWSLPVLRSGGRALVPQDVGPLSAYDAVRRLLLWSYTRMGDLRYQFGDRLIQIDQRRVVPSPGIAGARGTDESKIGVDTAQGWAAYLLDGTLFLKRFPHDPKGQYPDGGATIEVYSNHEFLELENLGPLTTIAPGEEIVLSEDWWLFRGVTVPTGEAEALESLRPFLERTAPG